MLPAGIGLEDLLPHRGRMVLIDKMIDFDAKKAITRSRVRADWPMIETDGANPLVIVELVAQTAGISNGWELLQREGPGADHRGWIVGVKSARFYTGPIPLGTEIEVESENTLEYDILREITGTARIEGRLAAEITLQLIQAKKSV
jgi:predicted hotdog family 3-hydroxylacyl-ACP dehydratase